MAIILLNFISHLLCSSRANLGSTLQSGLFVAARRFLREERGEQTRFPHFKTLTSRQPAYHHAHVCVMLAVVPSKARYKTSNDRNKHPRHRTARTTPRSNKIKPKKTWEQNLGLTPADRVQLSSSSRLVQQPARSLHVIVAKNASPPY